MPNIALLLAYEGTAYAGWQVQPNHRTIQGVLEGAISRLTGESVRVLSAGRTDSGVHALGQVASFHSDFPVPPHKWRPALQSYLPPDVIILESRRVPDDFHATFSARSKRYRYVIYNCIVDDPFVRRFSWRISQPLDQSAMHEAAQLLRGRHDFRSFESDWPNKATSVRTVLDISVARAERWALWSPSFPAGATEIGPGPFLCLEIEADGFLYNMVRAISGTLVNVGRGTWTQDDVRRVLQAQDRSVAGGTAPAQGLFMVQVHYPPVFGESGPLWSVNGLRPAGGAGSD